ncbi:MAG: hypothetical protein QF588_04535 [Candidatus Poseidoniaceae archaeon]|nr:hypothetical protein [Candidatus Poseidoniaceae archaeon]
MKFMPDEDAFAVGAINIVKTIKIRVDRLLLIICIGIYVDSELLEHIPDKSEKNLN